MKQAFFLRTRNDYFNHVDDYSLTILFSGHALQKSADQDYPFEVNKHFYYLTGINQENVICLLIKSGTIHKSYLFIDMHDETNSKWVGRKLTVDEAKEASGIDSILYHHDYQKTLYSILNSNRYTSYQIKQVYFDLERRTVMPFDTPAFAFSREIKSQYPELIIRSCHEVIIGLRMIKQPEELELIKASIATTRNALLDVMRHIKPGAYEYQMEAIFNHHIHFNGHKDNAFETICAGGKNASILHYVSNAEILKENQLLLMDLGCRSEFYVSDITRVYPISKRFTDRQKAIYNVVLETNKKCIAFLKPGVTWESFNKFANAQLIAGLKELHLIQTDEELTKYYWHSIGHMIGLDTHDPVLRNEPFAPGMVLTVEPGLYIAEEDIGIRIEDNVLITETGAINLSQDIIKEIDDIEALMSTI